MITRATRRWLSAASFGALFALAAPAMADEEAPNQGFETRAGSAREGERQGSPPDEGITNWWSWDYGASAKDPEHRHLPPPFGWAVVNFFIFLGILSRILWKPLKSGWIARHDTIKGELAEARRLHKEAEGQLAEYTRKVQNVNAEVDALVAQLRKEAEADRVRLIAAADAEAQRIKGEADRQIKAEIERARAELRREAVNAAVAAAEGILRRDVTADDQRRLAERYLGELDAIADRRGGLT